MPSPRRVKGPSTQKIGNVRGKRRWTPPAGALETDGGRPQKSFWRWPALHFPSRRAGTYDLAKAEEKYGIEAGTHWRDSDAPAPEVLRAAEEQQKHNVLDKGGCKVVNEDSKHAIYQIAWLTQKPPHGDWPSAHGQ
ncbi:hypothetical protein G5714_003333 [Onychostoma macrolepis]|uniref:Uncharacterized protein n=1 Tax=Onychostoma macrolepis TaxID=369639 RepID=A0A7J6DA72_9TELE|nr:hypothetical protein G5714_003333 [Onychostoma macrolepis]